MSKAVDDFKKFYSLDELIGDAFPQPLQEGEITIQMLAERVGCKYEKAKRQLKEWQEAGKMEHVGKRRYHGHSVDAWRVKHD